MSISHNEARAILRRAYERLFGSTPTDGEVDFGCAVAFAETGYGRAPGQFAAMAEQGLFNWGALESGTPDESVDTTFQRFVAIGLHPSKTEGKDAGRRVWFYTFPNDEEAAMAFLRTWGSADTLAAAATGDAREVAAAMKRHGYYEGFHVGPGGMTGGKTPERGFIEEESDEIALAKNIADYAAFLTRSVNTVRGGGAVPGPAPGEMPSALPSFGMPALSAKNVAIGLGLVLGAYMFATRTAQGRALKRKAIPYMRQGQAFARKGLGAVSRGR